MANSSLAIAGEEMMAGTPVRYSDQADTVVPSRADFASNCDCCGIV
jgi:hypothetical protein